MIELQHISKVYEGANRVEALKDINLTVKEGEIFGIIGQSGAGKSTLIRCINMLEAPTSGSVIVNGTDLTKLGKSDLRKARKQIGMIFQHFNLLSSRTVYDNVSFPLELQGMNKSEIKERIMPILDIVGLTERMNNYPSQLSGGQKQRVGIARALASNPKVLLCDEATSALDPQTTDSILKLLKNINEKMGLTIVLITHEMHVIREICDRVAVIEGGVILEEGSTLEVFTHPRENTTKDFISSVVSDNLPPEALAHLELHDQWVGGTAPLVRLKFTGGQATDEPVVAGLVRRFDLDVSILFGGIDYIQDTSVGRLIVILNGDPERAQEGLEYIKTLPIESEVIGYVRASH
nr:methionine ABC transporter ATP-binding protein [Veillonella denticariosi]